MDPRYRNQPSTVQHSNVQTNTQNNNNQGQTQGNINKVTLETPVKQNKNIIPQQNYQPKPQTVQTNSQHQTSTQTVVQDGSIKEYQRWTTSKLAIYSIKSSYKQFS